MQEKLHFKGVWFLPENREDELTGNLEFTPSGGIELDLLGVFKEGRSGSSQAGHKPAILLGITADGKKITLYKASRSGRGFHSSGFETSTYYALYMFIGGHFPEADDLKFYSINGLWNDFDYWLQIYGFKKNEFKKATKELSVAYQQPVNLLFNVSDNINCEFQFSTFSPNGKNISSLTVQQICEVSLCPKKGKEKFELLCEWFENFHRLLTLAYFQQPVIYKLTVGSKRKTEKNEAYIYPVEVYFQTETIEGTYKKRTSDYDFLFTYPVVKENFEQILQKWFEAAAMLEPVIAGLAEAFAERKQVTEFKFLNLAHAIETLHRRTRKNESEDKTVFKQKIKEILSSVPPGHSDWLKTKLEFSNELSLQERLVELANDVPAVVGKLLFKPSPDEFIKMVKRSRNFYTHYSKSLEKKALKGGELFILTERLKIFLICLVLKEIGFTQEEITKIILRKGVALFNHIIKYDEAKAHFSDW